jgi:predicted Zn-dependent peptidase
LSTQFTRFTMQPGVDLYVHRTTKFKTTNVYLYLHTPLQADTVTANTLLSMVLGRGSRQYPSTADLTRHLEDLYGAGFGTDVMRRGETHSILLRLDVANERYLPGGESLLPQGLQTLFGILLDPLTVGSGLKPEYVDQERTNLRQAIESLINDKRRYAMFRCTEEMCQGEPFALGRLGRAEVLDSLTPERLLQRHQELIRDAAIDIFVVGDVEPERVREQVAANLKLPADGKRQRPTTQVLRKPAHEPKTVHEPHDVNQGVLVLGLRTGVVSADPDYIPLVVANACLGGFPHSMLFQNVREKNSLAYFAYSALEAVKGIQWIYAGIEFENYQKCLDIMQAQLKDLQAGKIEQDLFDTTIRNIVGDIKAAEDRPGRMVEMQMENLFAGRDWSLADLQAAYEAVTPAQAAEAAAKISLDTVYFLTKK